MNTDKLTHIDYDYIEPCFEHVPSDKAIAVQCLDHPARYIHQLDICIMCGAEFDPGGRLFELPNETIFT